MINITDLPIINAVLNGISALLILLGFFFIKQKKVIIHKIFMLSAVFTSILFMISYSIYHFSKETLKARGLLSKFKGEGFTEVIYYVIVVSHSILATVIIPFVIFTLIYAFKNKVDKHKKLVKWTLPIWLYTSITGVLIYFMLYRWFS
ncbi:MAG: DUF420 domain-containing protein [Spirochaetota bacterium]|nr:DUF420 domain-containing protein [Spirochaetota bacterium]